MIKIALCGYPPFAEQIQRSLQGSGIDIKFFIEDFVATHDAAENFVTELPLINFSNFRQLVKAGELDGLIIAELPPYSKFVKDVVQTCKLCNIAQVYIIDLDSHKNLRKLDPRKAYVGYLETNIIDGCNLNCASCVDFSTLFSKDEFYPIENFQRDVCQLSKCCDVIIFRMMGGEPLLLKNLDEYVKIAQNYLPETNLRVVTNGLLIPSLPQKILDALRENDIILDVSAYIPTRKIADKIKATLTANKITFHFDEFFKDKFVSFMTLHPGNNTEKSRVACLSDICRFFRGGKIYKCQNEALRYRFEERFGIEGLPVATGVDIYAPNFPALLRMLDDDVEMCGWCAEQHREVPWRTTSNPKLEDWLADPDELKNFS